MPVHRPHSEGAATQSHLHLHVRNGKFRALRRRRWRGAWPASPLVEAPTSAVVTQRPRSKLACMRSLSGTDLSTAAIPTECREDACPSLTFNCMRSLSGTDLSTAAIPTECREDACPSLSIACARSRAPTSRQLQFLRNVERMRALRFRLHALALGHRPLDSYNSCGIVERMRALRFRLQSLPLNPKDCVASA
jgi:hypothetical protein